MHAKAVVNGLLSSAKKGWATFLQHAPREYCDFISVQADSDSH